MITPGDIIFTRKCPFCAEVIKLNKSECASCRDGLPSSSLRKIGTYKCAYAFPYSGEYRKAVLEYKFNGKHYYCASFAEYMKSAVDAQLADCSFDVVTYVPIYGEKRYRFNHSRTLAKHLSRLLSLPCEQLLVKTKHTQKQHLLSLDDRRHNVSGVFSSVDVSGKNILLVDDIITSGYTLAECIRTLKYGGANSVFCVTLCAVIFD
ncbi:MULTISPECIES: ComF family protein [unclassified Ruminococcus]|uniref:ComF family protein n=1 Tax=unclassified Ruminococcus TaxID=2608920 RepID=UPI00210E2195|nr:MULTISPECIES: phosphoribosyltransferase family protein [unclassified Ruminococcus]MCQ4022965.1 hypothetical protein [Ruminococcus sp. zg-924]MCQ4115337.1 hypothetical protein [Ruminococcus sp. zg-921]